jgi:hypothetical protein
LLKRKRSESTTSAHPYIYGDPLLRCPWNRWGNSPNITRRYMPLAKPEPAGTDTRQKRKGKRELASPPLPNGPLFSVGVPLVERWRKSNLFVCLLLREPPKMVL